jgi:hypothetical protein
MRRGWAGFVKDRADEASFLDRMSGQGGENTTQMKVRAQPWCTSGPHPNAPAFQHMPEPHA